MYYGWSKEFLEAGKRRLAYVETDPDGGRRNQHRSELLRGEYGKPLRIIAINAEEGWSRDVSESIAAKIRDVAVRLNKHLDHGISTRVQDGTRGRRL
jgi:hypothetical protein